MADVTTPNYGFTAPEPGGSDNTWGDKLNANWGAIDTLLKTFENVQPPVGTILMYDGAAALPANWAICDGTGGTPDLRDRFILGASATRPAQTVGGKFAITEVPAHTHAKGTLAADSGGDHSHTGTTDTEPDHTHIYTRRNNNQFVAISGNITVGFIGSNGEAVPQLTTTPGGAHSHALTIDQGGAHAHAISGEVASAGVASVDITPPYYSVVYIRRMT